MSALELGAVLWRASAALGWAVVQITWQATVLGALAFLALRIGKGVVPHRDRYRFLVATLGVVIVLPVITTLEVARAAQGRGLASDIFLHAGSVGPLVAALGWFGLGYAAWVLVSLLRLRGQHSHTRQLRAESHAPSTFVSAAFAAALARLPNAVRVDVGVNASVVVPQVVGWRRPMIVMPEHIEQTLGSSQLESIILHELVHLERGDSWANLTQCLVEALLPHPVVAWLSDQIRTEREFCCDERVVHLGTTSRVYATALGTLALLDMTDTELVPAATDGPLVQRIEALLGVAGPGRGRWTIPALAMLLMIPGLGFVTGYEPIPIRLSSGGHSGHAYGAVAPSQPWTLKHMEQEVAYPDTPAGNRARLWFEALASGEPDVLRAYFLANWSLGDEPYDPGQDVSTYRRVITDAEGIRPHSLLRSEPYELVMLAAGGNGSWLRMTVGVAREEPYLVTALSIRRSQGPQAEALGVTQVLPQMQREIALEAARMLRERYVFEDVGAAYAAGLEAQAREVAEPMQSAAFATKLTRQLQGIESDRHLQILDPGRARQILMMYGEPPEPGSPADDNQGPEAGHDTMMEGDGLGRVDRFPGGIAYLDIDRFSSGPAAMARAEEVMGSFLDASAIVFDLRGNGGGDGEMVEKLESYLFAEPTHIMNSIRRGEPGEPQLVVETWTTTNELSARMSSIPVFIFIDPHTGSASEAFAFGLENVGRATLLGQTSAGAGHRVTYERLPGDFAIGLPVGAAISPQTGIGWETVGVAPNVETSPDATLEELIEMVRARIR